MGYLNLTDVSLFPIFQKEEGTDEEGRRKRQKTGERGDRERKKERGNERERETYGGDGKEKEEPALVNSKRCS